MAPSDSRVVTPGLLLQLFVVVILVPCLPLLITQQWDWWAAWAYALVFGLGFVISRGLLARRYPDLLAERFRGLRQAEAKPWDRVLAPLVAFGIVLVSIVAGLDLRFGWSEGFAPGLQWAALAVILAGYSLGTWAMLENPFFSGVVRIQTERGHHVITTGPYRWMRHPGYAGTLLAYLATPLLLDSAWALLPALAVSIALLIRTRLEDETLLAELEGYRAYAERTRYRLVPGLW